ncbi:MAG: 50S ribosomal protein L29 [Acidimicrobiales bacterium]|nr:50S ribosomal protein L29 [Acidimicrobiales bacterium]RZV45157.1 MAG: 50S ribosomal protein L29 [Acidimicrobiales bacterium]
MAKKKLTELSDADLLKRLDEVSEDLFNLRFQNATGQLTNVQRLGEVRKDKARVLTELRMREIAAAEALEEEVAS